MLDQAQTELSFHTSGCGLYEISRSVNDWLSTTGLKNGLLTVFIKHTSASLTIQENADPDVCLDLTDALERLAPSDPRLYRHIAEGPDDMPAHIKAALTDVSLSIPVNNGRMTLGTWQGLYIAEHRRAPHTRYVTLHLIGS
ncbi:secondary thiamine-phosphate synthase enzyme YjbQ [Kordiimonas sp. SCSIO 12603]|uniref:secondary thiamine-phosphate synthase enzyme YjbQ n=1 Tax=Kordiimonas sp. SCSIO 12603 TaxID=2829596 RepID=UPI0021056534|nr:secondary thiamine-phosphate synthase enzyme YjbQ [Kordiimonas sp. SCSIO 12603]UTW58964.1 secondary thiamine-phosphate synthase enzyme YjbQ [Kordiimonas sp. SCSIO 12603]